MNPHSIVTPALPQWPQRGRILELPYNLGLGGGNSRATTVWLKPTRLWLPSQNGLFSECPQRQSEIAVRPARPNKAPVGSQISKSPSMRIGPLFWGLILTGISPDGSTGGRRETHLYPVSQFIFHGVVTSCVSVGCGDGSKSGGASGGWFLQYPPPGGFEMSGGVKIPPKTEKTAQSERLA
jgi:hypothetical protein